MESHLGLELPVEGGGVRLTSDGVAGLRFRLVEDSAEPFYFDATTRRYSYELEETTSDPNAFRMPLAQGGFFELPAGTHEIEFEGAPDCGVSNRRSWPGTMPNSIRLPVRDGYVTYGVCVLSGQ